MGCASIEFGCEATKCCCDVIGFVCCDVIAFVCCDVIGFVCCDVIGFCHPIETIGLGGRASIVFCCIVKFCSGITGLCCGIEGLSCIVGGFCCTIKGSACIELCWVVDRVVLVCAGASSLSC